MKTETYVVDFSNGDAFVKFKSRFYRTVSVQMITEGLNGIDAAVQVEKSNDDKNWLEVAGTPYVLPNNDDNFYDILENVAKILRLRLTANSVTVGTVKIIAVFSKHK